MTDDVWQAPPPVRPPPPLPAGSAPPQDPWGVVPRAPHRGRWAVAGVLALLTVAGAASLGGLPGGGSAVSEAEVSAALPELQAFVERERGLTFLHPVRVRVLDDDAFVEALFSGDGTTDGPGAAGRDATAHALGAVEPGEQLDDVLDASYADGVEGFYDDDSEDLVVRGRRLDAAARLVLVHELTHALQDQHFDLSAHDPGDTDDERDLAFSALVEGDATRVETAWYDAQPAGVRDDVDEAIGGPGGGEPTGDLVEDELGFPYWAGPHLVQALLGRGGQAALDAAFADPPTTTSQVLHLERAAPPPVPEPAGLPGGDVVDRGVLGEAGLAALLGEDPLRPSPAEGWAGDRFATVDEGGRACTWDDVVARGPEEAQALLDALEDVDGASVQETGETTLRLRVCGRTG